MKSGVLPFEPLEWAELVAALHDVIAELGGAATVGDLMQAASDGGTPARIALQQNLRQWVPAKGKDTRPVMVGKLLLRMTRWDATPLGRVHKVDGSGQSVRWGVGFVQPVKKAG